MTAADFEAAGLYDPRAPAAADRLALLEWLDARGITIAQMTTAASVGSLPALAADLTLRPGPRVSARELAARTGLSIETLLALTLAVGLPPRGPNEPAYTERDATIFTGFAGGAALFGETETRRFSRVVGSALARIAEAAVVLFQVTKEAPLRAAPGSELALAQANLQAIETLDVVRALLVALLDVHMEVAIRRLREARPRASIDTATFTVGFLDLVGFTTLSSRVAARELAAVVERFEEAAYDIAAARDGRVVKFIGDEVMFVTRDPAAACDIALTLVERFAGDPSVTPRGGLARGDVLVRGGDYYGPIVNLAARTTELAVPSEILVTPEVAAQCHDPRLRFEPAGKRMLKGFAEPVSLLGLSRDSA